ncbi:MAG: methyltransferase, partial [Bacillota bacterium]|nr:methyltransferase [Bacillota bacterium]
QLDKKIWEAATDEARSLEYSGSYNIWGGDIDPKAVEIAKSNAQKAGVGEHIRFSVSDAVKFERQTQGGIIVTNPPYGERLMDKEEAERLYRGFGKAAVKLDRWKIYLLSSHEEFEKEFGKKAVKKRKLYNGMIKCGLFMYY